MEIPFLYLNYPQVLLETEICIQSIRWSISKNLDWQRNIKDTKSVTVFISLHLPAQFAFLSSRRRKQSWMKRVPALPTCHCPPVSRTSSTRNPRPWLPTLNPAVSPPPRPSPSCTAANQLTDGTSWD